jgi:glycosyltransferase involved in cell wall biosynthesis
MRIALFSECYSPVANGVVTSVVTLRSTLIAQGHRVYLFAPGSPQPEDDADIFRLPELPFPRHPYHLARPFPRPHVDFSSLEADIVHCHHPFTVGRLGSEMARKYNLPLVYTAHSLYDNMVTYAKSPFVRSMSQKAVRSIVKRFCAKADYVITPSKYTREALRASGIAARFAVVPSGVVAPEVTAHGPGAIRSQFHLTPEMPLLLFLGRLGPEKRVDVLLRAAAHLAAKGLPAPQRDFRVALVGDGMSRENLEGLAAQLGIADRILFVGAQPHANIGDWYAAADLFTFSSPNETQGLALVEAMLAGLPCIAADYGGPREIVVQNVTGIRVPLEPRAFANAIEKVLLDPALAEKFGTNGLRRAAIYSPEAMTSGVMEVYNSVLQSPSKSTQKRQPLMKRQVESLTRVRSRIPRKR